MTKKKGVILVIAVMLLLAAAIAVLSVINRPDSLPETGNISVVSGGQQLREFSMDEVKAMDYVEAEKEIVSSNFKNDQGLFRGVELYRLLEAAGADLENASQVVARAEDGYVTVYPIDEVMEEKNILLIYAKNGESLGTLDSGGVGPFRILVLEDQFGNRCAKYVSELEVK